MAAATQTDGRTARWSAHRQARRAALVQAAMTAVEQHGSTVGMDQIAAVAGTSKAVFYRHFADKADLYRAVGEQLAEVFAERLQSRLAEADTPRQLLAAGIDSYLDVLERRGEVYLFVVRNPILGRAGGTGGVEYQARIAAQIDAAIARFSADADGAERNRRQPWGAAIVGFVQAAGDWWLDHPDRMSRAELTDSLLALLWNGAARLSD